MSTHISKLRVPVRLSQPNLAPRDGWFLLFPQVGSQPRPETVYELLNSPRSIIPFIQADDASVLLLMRDNIDWVAVGAGVESGLVFPPGRQAAQEQAVEIRFVDESRVEAVIRWEGGEREARLSDHLDASAPFVAAETGFGTLLVNKRRIRETRIAPAAARTRGSHAAPEAERLRRAG